MKVKLDAGAYAPVRAHAHDAGLDLRAPRNYTIPAGGLHIDEYGDVCYCESGSVKIDTGVHVELPHNTYGKIEAKSGLNVNHGVLALGGVIDEGYSGSIVVKLYNLTREPYFIREGDKIAQLLVVPCLFPDVEIVDSISGGERGADGFGSTGR